jgi:D-glycero-D-manno-heptose 1,7-bisphosphate phosphatase
MIREAAAALDIDLSRSYVIGDKAGDLESATRAGARGVLVRTGYGDALAALHQGRVPGAAHVAADLMEATAWVLVQHGHPHDPASRPDRF